MKLRLQNLFFAVAIALAFAPVNVSACAVCYGASDSPLAQGMNMGIAALLGFIGVVLGGITAFFIFIARNSAKLAAAAAQSQIPTDKQS